MKTEELEAKRGQIALYLTVVVQEKVLEQKPGFPGGHYQKTYFNISFFSKI